MRRVFLIGLLALSVAGFSSWPLAGCAQALGADQETYNVFAVVLEGSPGFKTPVVIRSELAYWPELSRSNVGIKGGKRFMSAWGSALDDYIAKARVPSSITRNIPVEKPYTLIANADLASIFKSGGDGWQKFYEKFPGSTGIISFSPVGFSKDGGRAIVQLENRCGGLCGVRGFHFLERQNGRWTEVKVDAEVMVWVS